MFKFLQSTRKTEILNQKKVCDGWKVVVFFVFFSIANTSDSHWTFDTIKFLINFCTDKFPSIIQNDK